MARNKKQKDLPGCEDRRLEDLHAKAIELEAVRTQRMALTKQESDLADEIRMLMEKYGKQESGYKMDGVEVEIVPPDGKTKVKVRVEHEAGEDETKPGEVRHISPADGADFDENEAASFQ